MPSFLLFAKEKVMTKRSESSGLPDNSAKTTVPKSSPASRRQLREYRSRSEREHEIQQYVVLGTLITAAAIVLILAGAFIYDLFITPNQAVAKVNDTTI